MCEDMDGPLARNMAGTRFTPTAFVRESEELASTRWQVSRLADVGGVPPGGHPAFPKPKAASVAIRMTSPVTVAGAAAVLIRKSALAFPLSLP